MYRWKLHVLGKESSCNCGRFEKANSRIWKGQNTTDSTRYPFQILLLIEWKNIPNKNSGCGGALITWKHVVTAAHCMETYRKDKNGKEIIGTRDNVYGEAFAGLEIFEDYINAENNGNIQIREFTAKDVKVHPSNNIQKYV